MVFNPNIAIIAVVTMVIGYLMVVAGLHKSALEWRRSERICPSCGKHISARVCSACTSR